jgi:hypothetical protein
MLRYYANRWMTPMGLVLKVRGHGPSQTKLAWSDDHWDPPTYSVSTQLVSQAAAKVRGILNRISEDYLTSPNPTYQPFLSDLARAGADLVGELFDPVDGDRETAAQVKGFIDDAEGRRPLIVNSDASIHVPWGFVYHADPDRMHEPKGEFSDFSGFWLDRFSISTRFNPCNRMPDSARPRENFRILMALHKSLHEKAQQHLPPDSKECFEKIKSHKVGAVADWELCRRKWREIEKQDSILYVYGHSDGAMIELDPEVAEADSNSKMEALRFHNSFRKADPKSASIAFLNGCVTGMGEGHNGFLRVTAMPGFYGFIGTEAKVPNKFASEYGIDFMHSLCFMGRSVEETFETLRIRHFPLSLLYSCFAHPYYRVEPAPEFCSNRGSQNELRID